MWLLHSQDLASKLTLSGYLALFAGCTLLLSLALLLVKHCQSHCLKFDIMVYLYSCCWKRTQHKALRASRLRLDDQMARMRHRIFFFKYKSFKVLSHCTFILRFIVNREKQIFYFSCDPAPTQHKEKFHLTPADVFWAIWYKFSIPVYKYVFWLLYTTPLHAKCCY